jgi:hypothetical protein
MKSFSQRQGLKPVSEIIQKDSMNSELRASLWNVLDIIFWSQPSFMQDSYDKKAEIDEFSRTLWFRYFKKPIDTRPRYHKEILDVIRRYFFEAKWFEIYDFIEHIVRYHSKEIPQIEAFFNVILERELSAYRFVSGSLTDVTSAQELAALEEALGDSRFSGPAAHLQRALELYASRDNPDYRNSIKESISAVESMASLVSNKPKAMLSDALKTLERNEKLHPALKDGFLKLYAYTSDEGGIRHAMQDDPNLSAADARYFLLSCTSFVNYLKSLID